MTGLRGTAMSWPSAEGLAQEGTHMGTQPEDLHIAWTEQRQTRSAMSQDITADILMVPSSFLEGRCLL